VARDSATDSELWECGFPGGTTDVNHHAHLYFLYVFWGLPLAFLVYAAVVTWLMARSRKSDGVAGAPASDQEQRGGQGQREEAE